MMPRQRLWFRSSCFALSVLAAVGLASCASDSKATSDEESASTVHDEQAALGPRINACAIQRQRLEHAAHNHAVFGRMMSAIESLRTYSEATGEERERVFRQRNWTGELRLERFEDIRLTADSDGIRIDGSAESFADVAKFVYRLNGLTPRPLTLAEASRSSDQRVVFQLGDSSRLARPFGGVAFDDKLFPPTKGRSLEEYADDLCDFGDESAPRANESLSEVKFEEATVARDGWLHPTLRARVSKSQIEAVIRGVDDYDGMSVHYETDEVVVDLYRTVPGPDFDARGWLDSLIRPAGVAHEHALDSPPGRDELITWEEEQQISAGVSHALLLGKVSQYRFQRIQRLYKEIAERHARTSVINALRERNARALRASLCMTRAYSAPADDLPDSKTRPLHAGKLTFSVPTSGVVADLSVERVYLATDGDTEWQFSSGDDQRLNDVQQALAVCMNAPDLTTSPIDDDQLARIAGKATAPSAGLFVPLENAVEPPRFEDGIAFALAVGRGNLTELNQKLYSIRNEQHRPQRLLQLARVSPPSDGVHALVTEFVELSGVYQVDMHSIRSHATNASGWTQMRPFLVELEAEASPADLLGFVTQLFDLDRVLVPAEVTISPGGDDKRLQVHAKLYAFFDQ